MNISSLKFPKSGQKHNWSNIDYQASSLYISHLINNNLETNANYLFITEDYHNAEILLKNLNYLLPNRNIKQFADWETLPYDHFSPYQDIIYERISTLYQLINNEVDILIVPATTLLLRISPKDFISKNCFIITKNQSSSLDKLVLKLIAMGYQKVSSIYSQGEFNVRGGLLDIFPIGSEFAYRIDYFDNDIETIRQFDINSPINYQLVDEIAIMPAHEFPLDYESSNIFRQKFRKIFQNQPFVAEKSIIYESVTNCKHTAGLEYYLPLFFGHTNHLLDYVAVTTKIVLYGNIKDALTTAEQQFTDRYNRMQFEENIPPLPPKQIIFNSNENFAQLKPFAQLNINSNNNQKHTIEFNLKQVPNFYYKIHKLNPTSDVITECLDWCEHQQFEKILFTTDSLGRRENLILLLKKKYEVNIIATWQDFQHTNKFLNVGISPFEDCCIFGQQAIISENILFGKHISQSKQKKQHENFETAIRSLAELEIGDLVVHEMHGIGRYQGLSTLNLNVVAEQEFLTLEYADNTKLYVPAASLNLVSRYTAGNPELVKLDKFGTLHWQNTRKKATKKIEDVAAKLLEIYAKREHSNGFKFNQVSSDYYKFCLDFKYEETIDQHRSINEVMNDMISEKAMDRLICGDVGFGKTEIANRAAFISVMSKKQVAILSPTTLLAQQHYENFCDRFANTGVKIAIFSRFQTKSEMTKNIALLEQHQIDIAIGTHKLLQKTIKFADLGLVIIDEEHRFGVEQKEKLRSITKNLDCLAMSATPIPRSLHLSISAVRDISIISTPPLKRLPIQTFVQKWDIAIAVEACQREIHRGGQVFVLENNISKIPSLADDLQSHLSNCKINFAHGQMPERQLAGIMRDFYHQKFQILICTTIIENGIDIPTANTIIINQANKFGLAQLHQIRGRVGRSHHQSYAYLFTPAHTSITKDAELRLDALKRNTELGAGFTLATQDLEIRGAGEILGEKQSGQIDNIGLSLYLDILNRTIEAFKRGENYTETQPIEIKLGVPSLIPEEYMPNVKQRLIYYKRIASANSKTELTEIKVELINSYGLIQPATQNLFTIAEYTIDLKQLGIASVTATNNEILIEFEQNTKMDPATIIKLIQAYPEEFKLHNSNSLKYIKSSVGYEERLQNFATLVKLLTTQ